MHLTDKESDLVNQIAFPANSHIEVGSLATTGYGRTCWDVRVIVEKGRKAVLLALELSLGDTAYCRKTICDRIVSYSEYQGYWDQAKCSLPVHIVYVVPPLPDNSAGISVRDAVHKGNKFYPGRFHLVEFQSIAELNAGIRDILKDVL